MPLIGEAKREYMRRYSAANRERENARCIKWYADNKERAAAYAKKYQQSHRERLNEFQRQYRSKLGETYRDREAARMREWREANREAYLARNRAWVQKRYHSDPTYRIICRLRSRLRKKLANRGIRKVKNSLALTGCTPQFLRGYLEAQFKPGMTWDNVHIDHHIPCAAFDLTDMKQQEQCFHYSNLKPLLAIDNLKKGNRVR